MNAFLIRLLIGCLIEWLFSQVINTFVPQQPANRFLQIILLLIVVLFVLFGGVLIGGASFSLGTGR